MSKIEELLEELCPEGVEWRKVQDLCKRIVSGGTPSTSRRDFYGGLIPWLRTQEVDWNDIYSTSVTITEEGLRQSSATWIPEKCVIVAMYGATAAKVAVNQIPLTTNQACCNLQIDELKANYKYVYYWLCNEYLNLKSLGEGSQSNINSQKVRNYPVPVPPLSIQEEIVKILDSFTALEAELEAELEARNAQYEYYRNKLLYFEGEDVEWKTLGEVGEIKRGVAFTKKQSVSGKFPVVANAPQPISFHNQSNRKGEFVVVARSGANAGLISYWNKDLFLTDAFSIHPYKSVLNTKFVFYFLKNHQAAIHSMKKGSGVPHVRASDFEIYRVPVPPLAEQERIVMILDQFDALVNDISQGLPAEIAARRQQYEYYRNKLLTFKPKS